MRLLFLVLVVLVACSRSAPEDGSLNVETKAKLKQRMALYCDLSRERYEANFGNVEAPGKCDGALFTALHGLSCDYVTVAQFESKDEPGKLCRDGECRCFYGDYGSSSGFSKDMAVGMQTYLAYRPDQALAQRVTEYGSANNWVVCDAKDEATKLGRCYMSPKIIDRWAILSGLRLQGQSEDALGINTGFQAHLDIVSVMVDRKLYGGASKLQKYIIKEQAKRVPQNLLFQAMHARYHAPHEAESVAQKLLKHFPADRLPTKSDYCTDYLWQRDYDAKDWLPCAGDEEHSGTDFLTAAWALLN
jgi:hypothetical protein